MSQKHNFHIPVMGTGFTLDSPIKVSRYGIDSVISVVDDVLMENLRKMYCEKFEIPYHAITEKIEDFRAKRITSYLNLVNDLATKKFKALKDSTQETGNTNVTMIDSVSKKELIKYLSLLDVAIINLKKDNLFKTVIPSKIFENAAMEIPILIGVDGEAREIVENFNAGLFYEPENEKDFIRKAYRITEPKNGINEFRKGGNSLAISYDRMELAKKMFFILKKMI